MSEVGDVVLGRFRIERMLGEGGMGAVVAATHIGTGGKVAIKFLQRHLVKDKDTVERFFREARIATQIRSDHVIRVLDAGYTEDGAPFIVMDLLEGSDLGRLVARGRLDVTLAIDCVLQASEALAEAHLQGIVHRDIKPANLWLTAPPHPTLKVLDFGISKLMPTHREQAQLTDTKAVFGSPAYMSPEQIRSAKHVDHRTDVWALGVVLHELLAGSLPFDADNLAGVLAAVISDPPRSLTKARPELPPEIERVVRSMLEKDPARRAPLAAVAAALLPFAGPAGRIAADRIARVGAPGPSLLPPAAASSEEWIGLAKTEPSLAGAPPGSRTRVWPLVALAVVVAAGLSGGATFVALRPPPLPAPSASITASTSVPASASVPDVPEVVSASASALVSAAPSASIAPPVASSSAPRARKRPQPSATATAPALPFPLSEDRHF